MKFDINSKKVIIKIRLYKFTLFTALTHLRIYFQNHTSEATISFKSNNMRVIHIDFLRVGNRWSRVGLIAGDNLQICLKMGVAKVQN